MYRNISLPTTHTTTTTTDYSREYLYRRITRRNIGVVTDTQTNVFVESDGLMDGLMVLLVLLLLGNAR